MLNPEDTEKKKNLEGYDYGCDSERDVLILLVKGSGMLLGEDQEVENGAKGFYHMDIEHVVIDAHTILHTHTMRT